MNPIPKKQTSCDLDDFTILFDEEWCSDKPSPTIADYLTKVFEDLKLPLLERLVPVDMEYRWKKGDFKTAHNYIQSFQDLLENSGGIEDKWIATQFELEWRRHNNDPKKWNSPEISADLVKSTSVRNSELLFWKLTQIEFDTEIESKTFRGLDYCRDLFGKIFGVCISIPPEIVLNQFQLDLKKDNKLTFDDYFQYVEDSMQKKLLLEMIPLDMKNRRNSGSHKWLEDYIKEYPSLLNDDKSIPRELVLRERSLACALEVGDNQASCPFCLEGIANIQDSLFCESCGRFIQKHGNDIATEDWIDEYQIIKILGVGGFGTVYKAWDRIKCRIIALKKPHSSKFVSKKINRFRREAKIVSKLNHSNIVGILDHKIELQPNNSHIVYEYVNGPVLTSLIKKKNQNISELLRIMSVICTAVGFAHKKRIVHRDLKPRNILINSNKVPLISDFGLAFTSRIIKEEDKSVEGQIIGTPEYMSPEQFQGEKVDYRSDIYSLGIIFYELLTGEIPFVFSNTNDFEDHAIKKHPPKPSNLNPCIPVELDRIFLRATEKNPKKRYGAAQEIAKDIERYLNGKEVHAKSDNLFSRLGSWCWWNPRMASVRVLLATMPLTILILIFYISLSKHLQASQLNKMEDRVLEILRKTPIQPIEKTDQFTKDNEKFQQTLEKLNNLQFNNQSGYHDVIEAFKKGMFEPAVQKFASYQKREEANFYLGQIHFLRSDFISSLNCYLTAFDLAQLNINEMYHDILVGIGQCYSATGYHGIAHKYFSNASKTGKHLFGTVHDKVATDWINLGDTWYYQGNFEKAKQSFDRAHNIDSQLFDKDHPVIARDLDRLGGAWDALGKYDNAVSCFEKALYINLLHNGGFNHPSVARNSWHLGGSLYYLGRYNEAKEHVSNALSFYELVLGPAHPDISRTSDELGGILYELGEYQEAIRCFERALEIDENRDPIDSSTIARDLNHLGGVYLTIGDCQKAVTYFQKGFRLNKSLYSFNHPSIARDIERLGKGWLCQKKIHRARAFFEYALGIDRKTYKLNHPTIARDIENIGDTWTDSNDIENAMIFYKKALEIYRKSFENKHPSIVNIEHKLIKLGCYK